MDSQNYLKYTLTLKEIISYFLIFEFVAFTFSFFFYHSYIPVIVFQVLLYKYFVEVKNYLSKKRRKRILTEFSDFIVAISASLYTGYSLENAIIEAKTTIKNMYGSNSIMYTEILFMERKLSINSPVENLFLDLAERTGIEDIQNFCVILNIAKKTGGDLISIIKSTSQTIKQKSDLICQIDTAVSGKRFEQYIMLGMPFFIFIYVGITQPGFFTPLYNNLLGIIVSTTCLIIYCCSFILSRKILRIEV